MHTSIYHTSVFRQLEKGARILEPVTPKNNSLFSGKLGQVLYLSYAYKLTGDQAAVDKAMALIDEVLSYLQGPLDQVAREIAWTLPSLCFVLKVIREDGILDIDLGEDELKVFDELIYTHTGVFLRDNNMDYLFGAPGSLHYLLTRLDENPAVAGYLEWLIGTLDTMGIEDERGIRFFNSHVNRQNKSKDLDTGLAHGQCGLLLVLLKVYEAGICRTVVRRIIEGMLHYLRGLKMQPDREAGYPSFYPVGMNEALDKTHPVNRAKYNNRMGWCYGDLNMTLVFYRAARILDLPVWMDEGDEVGLDCVTRLDVRDSDITAGHICHGSASLVLLFNALYEERPLAAYLDASAYWTRFTEEYLERQLQDPEAEPRSMEFLMGIPGSLLTLITGLLPGKTHWEQILLL